MIETLAAHILEPADDDPFAMFAEWDSGQIVILAILIPIAIAVSWYGTRSFTKARGASTLRPRGRPFYDEGTGITGFDTVWRERVVGLEARPPTKIAEATGGTIRIQGKLVNASGNLGGRPGRECVWRNRAGARPDSAVGAELVVVADATGQCGVENLERARVIAPAESHGLHYENVSLYLGDEVECIGTFESERVGDDADPTKVVYGTLGGLGPVQVRLVQRPVPDDAEANDDEDDDPSEAAVPQSEDAAAPAEDSPDEDEP